jgi:hypothetical protein
VVETSRRVVLGGVLMVAAVIMAGCNMGTDIPVVQFPEGSKPSPPAPVPKVDSKSKHFSKLSKGDPSVDNR